MSSSVLIQEYFSSSLLWEEGEEWEGGMLLRGFGCSELGRV